jgi:protein-histidine pros-kinase
MANEVDKEATPPPQELRQLFGLVDSSYKSYAGLLEQQLLLSGDAYSDWNLKTGTIESGQQWKSLLGYGLTEVGNLISHWQSLVHTEDLAGFQMRLHDHAKHRKDFFEAECRIRGKNGEWLWILIRGMITAQTPENLPLRMLVMQRNITALKVSEINLIAAKELAESAMAIRSAFIANMSHEIRTPLGGIVGMIDLTMDTQLDAEQRHYLKTAKNCSDALLAVVNDILDFSKIDAGKIELEQMDFFVRDVLLEASRIVAINAHKKNLELTVEIDSDVPEQMVGDPTRLRQIILNLLSNAIKFTEHGEVLIRVCLESVTPIDTKLVFSVSDTGVGIPIENQQGIFEAFSQADLSTTRRYGGTGLGLTICSRLLQLMNGRIWLNSEPGKGSDFRFCIPFKGSQALKTLKPTREFSGKLVLIIEPSPNTARCLENKLLNLGANVTYLPEITEALDVINRYRSEGIPFDFIISNYQKENATEASLTENWIASGKRENLVIMLTANNQRQGLDELRSQGVLAHLVKPFGDTELVDALRLAGDIENESSQISVLDPPSLELKHYPEKAGLNILLVEDNPVNQELAVRLLQKRMHSVTIANNGAEAMDQFEQKRFDVILMDMQMPVMNGIEATEAIRSREMRRTWVMNSECSSVYIIAMTANVMEKERELCSDAGMNDFIPKPLVPDVLYAALERARAPDEVDSPSPVFESSAQDSVRINISAALNDLGDAELLHTMAKMFLSDWVSQVNSLKSAIKTFNQEETNRHAHTLRSVLSIFHVNNAREIARKLEQVSISTEINKWLICNQLQLLLESEIQEILPVFEDFIFAKTRF